MLASESLRYGKQYAINNYSDPSQPHYRPIWWVKSVEHWCKTLHWTGMLDDPWFKNLYLCRVPGELTDDRNTRIEATSPEPYFKDAVTDHASIFSQFELAENAPQTLIEHQENVDLAGTDLWQWSMEPMKALFRDGGALLGCLSPEVDEEEQDRSRRPRLLWVPMRDVFWPEYEENNGAVRLSRIAVRRGKTLRNKEGGLVAANDYWVYELVDSQCIATVWEENLEGKLVEGDAKTLRDASGNPLTRLPFSDKLSWIGDFNLTEERQLFSPFADILNLNCEHYNARSEYQTVLRKTALPTAIRYWANGVPENIPPFYAGTGRTQDYAAGSKVEYLELSGSSLPEIRSNLDAIERKIAMRDNKLFHVGDGTRSATEAAIENQKAKVGMPGIKNLIESAFQDLFSVWELFANPTPDPVGGIIISEQALSAPPDPQAMLATMSTVDRGVPIQAAINKLIRDGHFKPEDFGQIPFESQSSLPIDPDEVIA
ncbi:MAG: DUF4055 domain-containing protein [Cyanobacteria bacterium P01_D01_bin.36]